MLTLFWRNAFRERDKADAPHFRNPLGRVQLIWQKRRLVLLRSPCEKLVAYAQCLHHGGLRTLFANFACMET
ncbi:MAG: hypothetical protein EAZ24_01680 [Burkholderiales bacterium]|nr:MAG: hypothetical protein EAZ21_11545 [Betaproteobacteria bacterium]TAG84237.1 MAG: hypothetical protein EAZ24_01680 [Burkholderiales bacterium]